MRWGGFKLIIFMLHFLTNTILFSVRSINKLYGLIKIFLNNFLYFIQCDIKKLLVVYLPCSIFYLQTLCAMPLLNAGASSEKSHGMYIKIEWYRGIA